jgi:hypothetical protein
VQTVPRFGLKVLGCPNINEMSSSACSGFVPDRPAGRLRVADRDAAFGEAMIVPTRAPSLWRGYLTVRVVYIDHWADVY